jgi:hypothetical protein
MKYSSNSSGLSLLQVLIAMAACGTFMFVVAQVATSSAKSSEQSYASIDFQAMASRIISLIYANDAAGCAGMILTTPAPGPTPDWGTNAALALPQFSSAGTWTSLKEFALTVKSPDPLNPYLIDSRGPIVGEHIYQLGLLIPPAYQTCFPAVANGNTCNGALTLHSFAPQSGLLGSQSYSRIIGYLGLSAPLPTSPTLTACGPGGTSTPLAQPIDLPPVPYPPGPHPQVNQTASCPGGSVLFGMDFLAKGSPQPTSYNGPDVTLNTLTQYMPTQLYCVPVVPQI